MKKLSSAMLYDVHENRSFWYGRFVAIGLMLLLFGFTEAFAQAADVSLAQVDELRARGSFIEAKQALEGMVERKPGNAEAWWRLARSFVELGDLEESDDGRMHLLELGRDAARKAIAADSSNSNAHLSLAIASGRIALEGGNRQKVELSRVVKEEVDRAIELDPENALAYHVRARWNYAIADLGFFERAALKLVYGGVPAASFEQAARDYEKAARLENRAVNHLELGRTYIRLGEREKARAALGRALNAPNADPSDPHYKQEARELLRDLD